MKKVLVCCLLELFSRIISGQNTTVVLQPDSACGKDAPISSLFPDQNFGNHPDFLATAWTNGGSAVVDRSLLEFNMSWIPKGTNVVNATLDLFHYNSTANIGHSNLSGPDNASLYRVTQSWDEHQVTWNNQPTYTTLNRVMLPASTSSTQNYSVDVTALVQDMINNPLNSFGFIFKEDTEQYYRSMLFASSNESNPAFHPRLTLVLAGQITPGNLCYYQLPLNVSVAGTNATCNGKCDGSVSVAATEGTPPYLYSWSPGGEVTPSVFNLCPGIYTVTVSDSNGNIVTSTAIITQPPVAAHFATDVTIGLGSSIPLHATESGSCTWSPAEYLSCISCPDPLATPLETTTYCVIQRDTAGCTSTGCTTVHVECGDVYVPNYFSPNSDGVNDVLCVYGSCIKEMQFNIYDRWGEKVFETNDKASCWDGVYKGENLNTGVFVYFLKATLASGEVITWQGNITLAR